MDLQEFGIDSWRMKAENRKEKNGKGSGRSQENIEYIERKRRNCCLPSKTLHWFLKHREKEGKLC